MSDQIPSITLPQETFFEIQAQADAHSPSLGERAANTAQATLVFGAMGAAFVGASWGWAYAMDWLDEKKFKRSMRKNGHKTAS